MVEVTLVLLLLFVGAVCWGIYKYTDIWLGKNLAMIVLISMLSGSGYICVRHVFVDTMLTAYYNFDYRAATGFGFLALLTCFIIVYILSHAYKVLRRQKPK